MNIFESDFTRVIPAVLIERENRIQMVSDIDVAQGDLIANQSIWNGGANLKYRVTKINHSRPAGGGILRILYGVM